MLGAHPLLPMGCRARQSGSVGDGKHATGYESSATGTGGMRRDFKRITPEAAGIPSAAVANFIDRLEDKTLPIHSFLVLKGDTIATEAYWKPFDATFRHRMYSTSKSFVSVAIGILAGDGRLSLDDRAVDFFPEY